MKLLTATLAAIALTACAAPVTAIDGGDEGIYAATGRQPTINVRTFRLARSADLWTLEERKPDGAWAQFPCSADCALRKSAADDLKRIFPAQTLSEIVPHCLHNAALAFCRYSIVQKPQSRSYVLVTFAGTEPIPVRLARIGPRPEGK